MPRKFQGAITALVTPFTKGDTIDVAALRQLVRSQIDGGIDGLVPCGTTGEAATLTDEEYCEVIEIVVDEAGGRVPVIAGAGSNNTAKAVRLSQIAKDAGADALLHVSPYYNKPTPSGLIAHFAAIAGEVDLPIIAYNVPGRTGSNISSDVLLRLIKEVPQIVGIKEASGDLCQIMQLIQGAPSDFAVLSGDDALTLPILSVGGHGVISVVSNEIPGEFAAMVHAAQNNDWTNARKLHYEWFDLMSVNFVESNPIPVKTALALMGNIQEVFRLPLTTLETQNREELSSILKNHGLK